MNPTSLEAVEREVHDLWIDVENIRVDAHTGVAVLPIFAKKSGIIAGVSRIWRRAKRETLFSAEGELRVSGIRAAQIQDVEGIRFYNFHSFSHDDKSGALVIRTGIPTVIRFSVNNPGVTFVRLGRGFPPGTSNPSSPSTG